MALRFDRGELTKPVEMANGWLRLDGYLTRTGVFEYLQPDGSVRRELRPPEEVFKADSLDTFALVPITDEHPPAPLDASNARQYARGSVGEVKRDSDKVRATLLVTDADLVTKLKRGDARQVSCGYTCDLEDAPGTFGGQRYDAVQRNIRGNHVAIVPKARAGADVRVRMDGAGTMAMAGEVKCDACGARADACRKDGAAACCDSCSHPQQKTDADRPCPAPGAGGTDSGANPHPAGESPMAKTIRIDGIDLEAGSEAFQQAYEKQQAKQAEALAAAAKRADAAEAKADAAAEETKKARAELEALPGKLRADMQARANLEAKARQVLGAEAKLDGLDTRAVQAAVLAKLAPEAKVEGKSDAYVEARFDHALEVASKEKKDGDSGWVKDSSKLDAEPDKKGEAGERLDSDAASKKLYLESEKLYLTRFSKAS